MSFFGKNISTIGVNKRANSIHPWDFLPMGVSREGIGLGQARREANMCARGARNLILFL